MKTKNSKISNDKSGKATYDVRIALYNTAKGDAICIRFRESLEELIMQNKDDRIGVMRVGRRLYFVTKRFRDCTFGDGTACVANQKLQYSRKEQVDTCKSFVGEFPLAYDADRKLYFVDLDDKQTFGIIGKSNKNIPHNYGKRTALNKVPKFDGEKKKEVKAKESKDTKFFDAVDVRARDKEEILRLLDILDADDTQSYARAIVRLVKEKIKATY